MANDRLFAFAGLWEHWEGADPAAIESYTIIRTDANDCCVLYTTGCR